MTSIPTSVTFRGLVHSDALDSDVRQRIAWLQRLCPDMVRCRVLVELPHRHRRDGRHFHVRIEVTVPASSPIIISHEPSLHGRLKDVNEETYRKETEIDSVHRYAAVAVREAFDAARRRLEEVGRDEPRPESHEWLP